MAFADFLSHAGKPVVLRKRNGDVWADLMVVAEIQKVSLSHNLVAAGILQVGDAVGFFPSWTQIENDDRVVFDGEYSVNSVNPLRVGDETVCIKTLLKQVRDTVQADFYGSNRVFFDDFDVNRESWTVKSGSWSISESRYVGEADDSFSIATALAGSTKWKNYVVEVKVKVENGDASLLCRYTEPNGIPQYFAVSLRVNEQVIALDGVQGETFGRLAYTERNLEYNTEYTVRVHCFDSYIIVFLDGEYVFTVSDLSFLTGQIGLEAIGGKSSFDDVTVWEV